MKKKFLIIVIVHIFSLQFFEEYFTTEIYTVYFVKNTIKNFRHNYREKNDSLRFLTELRDLRKNKL